MPPRFNEFQTLVHLIQAQLAPKDFTVTEGKPLSDRRTGKPREVDVVIEGPVGPNRVVICVEARKSRRRADVEWVERMCAKHENLETNKLVLVSPRGFTRRASEEARLRGADALTLKQAAQLDWRSPVPLKTMLLTYRRLYPSQFIARIDSTPGGFPTGRLREFILDFENGARRVPLTDVIKLGLQDADLNKRMAEDTLGPDRWGSRTTLEFRSGTRLVAPDGRSVIIHDLSFLARYRESAGKVDLQFARLGATSLIHGSATADFGTLVAVMTDPQNESPMIGLDFVPGTEPDGGSLRIEWRDAAPGA